MFGSTLWDLGTTASDETYKNGYTIFEPQNTDIFSTRLYNNSVNYMQSGGTVAISGYTVCENGVNRYKYSLDNGATWTIITKSKSTNVNDSQMNVAKLFDNSWDTNDARKGNYMANDGSGSIVIGESFTSTTSYNYNTLNFQLPELDVGSVRNLLVVAESNDASGNPSGKLYPILHMKVGVNS